MAVDAQNLSRPIYNHGGNVWKTTPPATGGSGSVSLTVPAMTAPTQHVFSGIPFPKGELLQAVNARLVKNSVEIPASYEVLANWEDGSIKSVCVGASIDPDPVNPTTLSLVYDDNAQSVYSGLTISEDASNHTIDTGKAVFTISKTTFNVLTAAVGGTSVITGGDVIATNAHDSLDYKVSVDTGFTIVKEFEDTQKAVYRLDGSLKYSSTVLGKIRIWYEFYDNCEYCNLKLRFVDDVDEPNVLVSVKTRSLPISISNYRLELTHNSMTSYGLATENGNNVNGTISTEHYINQDGYWDVVNGAQQSPAHPMSFSGAATGTKCEGWIAAGNGSRYGYVMCRHFWQQYPGEIAVDSTKMKMILHSTRGKTPDTVWPTQGVGGTLSYVRPNTMYWSYHGGCKTYELRVGVASGAPDYAAIAAHKAEYDKTRFELYASNEWYCATGIWPELVARNADNQTLQDEVYNAIIVPSTNRVLTADGAFFNYGWRDFGDQSRQGSWSGIENGVRVIGWYNDTHGGATRIMTYGLSSGNHGFFDVPIMRILHYRDFGHSYARKYGKRMTPRLANGTSGVHQYFGPGEPTYQKHDIEDHESQLGSEDHMHCGALPEAWLLFADRQAKATMENFRNFLEEVVPSSFNHNRKFPWGNYSDGIGGADREYGWPLWSYFELYRAFNDTDMVSGTMAHIVEHLMQWIKGETNSNGWPPAGNHIIRDVEIVDPRTGSSTIDWSAGTGNFQMWPGQTNSSEGFSNGNNPWQLSPVLVSLIRFHDLDTELGNISGVNLAEVREALYQCIRYLYLWTWLDAYKFWIYSEGNAYDSQGEPYGGGYNGWLTYAFARTYELWHGENQAGTLMNPVGYYEQMANIRTNILDYFYTNFKAFDYNYTQQSFGLYGAGDIGLYQEALTILARVDALA